MVYSLFLFNRILSSLFLYISSLSHPRRPGLVSRSLRGEEKFPTILNLLHIHVYHILNIILEKYSTLYAIIWKLKTLKEEKMAILGQEWRENPLSLSLWWRWQKKISDNVVMEAQDGEIRYSSFVVIMIFLNLIWPILCLLAGMGTLIS